MSILDLPLLSRLRRNHALEHATISLLAQRFPRQPLAGYSFPGGFIVLGEVPAEAVRSAALEALTRLQNGEWQLAIHPYCGTNLLTTALLAGLLGWLSLAGARTRKEKLAAFPLTIGLVMTGIVVSQPLGPLIQKHVTTCSNPQRLSIVDVVPLRIGRRLFHRVLTQG
jgi:hypothetical protein